MQRAVFTVFDFDNMLFDTMRLKNDLEHLAHDAFPSISPETFFETYFAYRLYHSGKVHMKTILSEVAKKSALSPEDTKWFTETWLTTIPYDRYIFPEIHELMGRLDPNRVFIFTKSEDQVYQAGKIEACNLGIRKDHVLIPPWKSRDAYHELFTVLKQCECTDVIYGADEATELLRGQETSQEFGMHFEGIHHFYGEYRYNGMSEADEVLGSGYHRIDDIRQLSDVMCTLHRQLEGAGMPPEGNSGGKERI